MRLIRLASLAAAVALSSISCAARAQQQRLPPSTTPTVLPATKPVSLFDPARHMRVSEVKAGMKGYGLSVFHGTEIEKFDVEVVSVLHNFNPQYDVVLIRCSGQNLEHTGAIAGMSGSPIYLTDEQGRSRLIGAFAYGWSLMKDPIAGVQPIEYMLEVGATLRTEAAATQASQTGAGRTVPGTKLAHYDPLEPIRMVQRWKQQQTFAARGDSSTSAIQMIGNGDVPQLTPLSTPLMTAGISAKSLKEFAPMLRDYGLVALQAGSVAGTGATTRPAEIAPGSVLAAPLLTGDVDMTAIGTCTEVLGDRIFGFGHPFNNEGPITLPMGAGEINGIIASLSQSFKIGSMTQIKGTLIADQAVGVAGRLGRAPPTVPIDVHVIYTDGSMDVTYHFDAAPHPRLTPTLAGVAIQSAMSGRRDLPQYHTVDYDLSLRFANDKIVEMKDVAVNVAEQQMVSELQSIVEMAAENPFERVMLRRIEGTVRVTPEAHEADILSVNLAKTKYKPGETLKAFVRYRPFRQDEAVMPVDLQLPHDLKDGKYQLSVSDRTSYLMQELSAKPFRFDAQSTDDVFAVLKDVSSVRSDSLYIRLARQSDGLAVGRTALQKMPPSRKQVLLDSGRSDITEFVSSAVKIVPAKIVMNGSADFEIEISSEDRVEVGGARATRAPEQRGPTLAPAVEPARGGGRGPAPMPPTPPRGEPPTPPEGP
jgi:hypothetical protein